MESETAPSVGSSVAAPATPAATVTTDSGSATVPPVAKAPNPPAQSAPQTPPVVEPDPVVEDEPEPVFDFKVWDGKVDSLPEDIRDLGKGFYDFYSPQLTRLTELEETVRGFDQVKAEREELEELYKALSAGEEDPRISTLTSERDDWKGKHEALVNEISQWQEQQALQMWSDFKEKHPHLSRSPKIAETVGSLVDEGWDWDLIPTVLELPKASLTEVRDLVKSGTPSKVALEFVTLKSAQAKEKSTPSTAHLVAGAENPGGNPASMDRSAPYKKLSWDERKEQAILRRVK